MTSCYNLLLRTLSCWVLFLAGSSKPSFVFVLESEELRTVYSSLIASNEIDEECKENELQGQEVKS